MQSCNPVKAPFESSSQTVLHRRPDPSSHLVDRQSTSSYIFRMNNDSITQSSRKQFIIALFTMESEYFALSEYTKEVVLICKLFKTLYYPLQVPLLLCTDSDAALDHIKN